MDRQTSVKRTAEEDAAWYRDARRVLRGRQTSVSSTAEEDAVWYRDARRVPRGRQTSVSSTVEEDAVWYRDARRVPRGRQTSVSSTVEEDAVWYRDARRVPRGRQTSVSSTAAVSGVHTASHGQTRAWVTRITTTIAPRASKFFSRQTHARKHTASKSCRQRPSLTNTSKIFATTNALKRPTRAIARRGGASTTACASGTR
jgi:ADP-ribose pyrophosphatase YjhB (NUDIX family)